VIVAVIDNEILIILYMRDHILVVRYYANFLLATFI